jgi:ATP-dependent RNA helicase DeaD
MLQAHRERTVAALKAGSLDIVVATDVAARGLDVDRISHVVNFDVPYDSESYVHRIGRTGRAGRNGEAILFIAPRERHMLRIIERATRQPIEPMTLPSAHDVNRRRVENFKKRLSATLAAPPHEVFRSVVEEFIHETGASLVDVAAALASLAQGDKSLVLHEKTRAAATDDAPPSAPSRRPEPKSMRREGTPTDAPRKRARGRRDHDEPQATYRLEVGHRHGVHPGNIVGAIAHEADLAGSQINRIDIREDHTFVKLPADLSPKLIAKLRKMRINGQRLDLSVVNDRPPRDRKGS